MTPDERLALGLWRWLNRPRYSAAWFWACLVIAAFIGHFL